MRPQLRKFKAGESFILEGPSSIRVVSGEVNSLGVKMLPGQGIVIPEFKSLPFLVEKDCELELRVAEESSLKFSEEYLPKDWVELSEKLASVDRQFTVVVLGDLDSGKSTLTTFLANVLLQRGRKVAVIDADTGQKDLGAPGTIGMKILDKPTPILSGCPEDSAFFVGSTSPAGLIDRSIAGVLVLVNKALKAGVEAVLIDTTGWVYGREARELKTVMINALTPEFIIAIQRRGELESLLRSLVTTSSEIIRVSAPKNVRARSRSERKAIRSRVFRKYLKGGKRITLSMRDIAIQYSFLGSGGELDREKADLFQRILGETIIYGEEFEDFLLLVLDERSPIDTSMLFKLRETVANKALRVLRRSDFKNVLCGLLDKEGCFIGLGILEDVDFKLRKLNIYTSVEERKIAVVQIGSMKVNREGMEEGWIGSWRF